MQIGLALYCFVCLWVDAHLANVWEQDALGLFTLAVLFLLVRRLAAHDGRLVWMCVLVASGVEVFASLIWGVYRYRWGNVPWFVPPGHGMVYVFGITAARTPLMRRHAALIIRTVFVLATAWAVAGLTVLPHITGRLDVLGALFLPIFALFLLRSPRAPMFAAIFVATSGLELIGVNMHTWMWQVTAPISHIPSGNPPSVIAGGYCVIDGSAVIVGQALWGLARRIEPLWIRVRSQVLAPLAGPETLPSRRRRGCGRFAGRGGRPNGRHRGAG
jgi:hypothetical protein